MSLLYMRKFLMYQKGLSLTFFLLIGFLLVIFSTFVPLPHYNVDNGWYQGPSIAARMLGADEPGAPIEQVYSVFLKAAVQSPFELNCEIDSDCKILNITNQCKAYCANTFQGNIDTAGKLSNNRVCDPAKWVAPSQNCKCVLKKCISVNY